MPLKNLVINSRNLQEEAIEKAVKGFISYGEDGEILVTNSKFWKLHGEEKVQRFLAAISGREFLGLENQSLDIDGLELTKKLNMNKSSTRVYLSQLRSRGLVETKKNKHRITNQGLHDLLQKEKTKR